MQQAVENRPGYFGEYGGQFVPETLMANLIDLEKAFLESQTDRDFQERYQRELSDYVGRPSPLYLAENLSREWGGKVYLKREDCNHTGAHKINNAIGQALLALKLGKKRVVAETGAGQHGVATAAACARLGLKCVVYMGALDCKRQLPNVQRMKLLGAEVHACESGSRNLKVAINEAIRDWIANPEDTHYLIGSALGPSPYPSIVKTFQSVIGKEVKSKIAEKKIDVEAMVACVGGGSNAIGFFSPFLEENTPRLIGVEAGGKGPDRGKHASRMSGQGKSGIIQGYKSLFLTDKEGQILPTHSISAGLDYPGIGPELAYYGKTGRIEYTSATDAEALEALQFFAKNEGILFALESAHAGAKAIELAGTVSKDKAVIINMSGRGDKDIFITAKLLTPDEWLGFLRNEV
ncbi:MAG: tryptophan synthase subunit beta [Spirochaetales bacterium]|nr:tryptophan synthase subunit beta [Spirochaetales bacterium]